MGAVFVVSKGFVASQRTCCLWTIHACMKLTPAINQGKFMVCDCKKQEEIPQIHTILNK